MEHEPATNPYLVATEDGYVVDLGPLIKSANAVRRNALLDSELEESFSASPMTVAAFQLGMRVAVEKLFSEDVARVFDKGLLFTGEGHGRDGDR